MRIRHKPWARPELEACSFYVREPVIYRGRWAQAFQNGQPIQLELGCGKGGFMAELASHHPEVNFLVVDIKSEMLAMAKRNIEKPDRVATSHVRLMSQDIERIDQIIAPEDRIERIYINFCNPWPKDRHKKHRLTHTRQLLKYKEFLVDGGEIWFKTDDDELFEDSIGYFNEAGYEISYQTWDLAKSGFPGSIPTEHEEMFVRMGKNIKFLVAAVCEGTSATV